MYGTLHKLPTDDGFCYDVYVAGINRKYCLMDTQLADVPVQLESCKALAQPYTEEAQPYEPQFSKLTLQDYVTESKNHAAYSSLTHYPRLSMEWQFVAIRKERTDICVNLKKD